ncbi:HupE/UreJ family protein [Zhongshania sp. BJYM1]|uniref:HupE/UreJ family protein n=1 Tax=Zhongshania aquatica TaxID=2965069 RepID=UPI0022B5447C|nr:HupE/UreJ family protein [Marortus sp. BJYM1]
MMSRVMLLVLLVGLSVAFPRSVLAHKASDSFMYITADQIRLDIALQDMQRIQSLDLNNDSQVEWGELRTAEAAFSQLLAERISISSDDESCPLVIKFAGLSEHSDGPYGAWLIRSNCLAQSGAQLSYSLLFDVDPLHRALLVSDLSGEKQLGVLSPSKNTVKLNERVSALDTAEVFLWQGAVHLLLGYDHMLFLLALLLPATRHRKHGAQLPLRRVFTDVALVVTMFTLAHSFTLVAASLGWFSLPSQPVEIAIALSISLAAVLALMDVDARFQRGLAMGVGLIHGFGFAGVLSDLLAASSLKLLALGSFNVGIELAQLALVILVLPLLYRYSFHAWYQKKAFPLAAISLAASGLYMAFQRI